MNKQAISLLNQIIQKAEEEDLAAKAYFLSKGKAEKSVGEGWMIFHLKILKELLTQEK